MAKVYVVVVEQAFANFWAVMAGFPSQRLAELYLRDKSKDYVLYECDEDGCEVIARGSKP